MSSEKSKNRPFGCLLALLGVPIGLWLAQRSFELEVQKMRAQNPKAFICGNMAIPVIFLGLIGGTLGGLVIGKTIEFWLSRSDHEVSTSATDSIKHMPKQEE